MWSSESGKYRCHWPKWKQSLYKKEVREESIFFFRREHLMNFFWNIAFLHLVQHWTLNRTVLDIFLGIQHLFWEWINSSSRTDSSLKVSICELQGCLITCKLQNLLSVVQLRYRLGKKSAQHKSWELDFIWGHYWVL